MMTDPRDPVTATELWAMARDNEAYGLTAIAAALAHARAEGHAAGAREAESALAKMRVTLAECEGQLRALGHTTTATIVSLVLAEMRAQTCETCLDNDCGICNHLMRVEGRYVRCEHLGNFCGMWRARDAGENANG